MKLDFKGTRMRIPRMDLSCSLCKYTKGIEIGIPLNIYQNIFTHNHYGKEIMNPGLISLQFLLGYYTYGKDTKMHLNLKKIHMKQTKKNFMKIF